MNNIIQNMYTFKQYFGYSEKKQDRSIKSIKIKSIQHKKHLIILSVLILSYLLN